MNKVTKNQDDEMKRDLLPPRRAVIEFDLTGRGGRRL
jgi:hypothetical protein